MIPYFLYFFLSLSILLANKKFIPILYSLIWFVFVGLRDGVGTDYYGTLKAIQRSYIDFENPIASFTGYYLVDTELIYKFMSTIFYYSQLDIIYVHVLIAAIQAILIYFLLKKVNHKKLLVIYFVALFTLHFPMNAQRQGFSLLLLIFALNYFNYRKVKRAIFIFLSMMSHYASIPLILLSSMKIKNKKPVIIVGVLIAIFFYSISDLIIMRFPASAAIGYTNKGLGIKLIVGAFLLLMINYWVIKKRFWRQENIIIIALMLATYIYGPFGRYYHFYAHLILFSNLFALDSKRIGINSTVLLLTYPLFYSFTIWHEISRFIPFDGGGIWIPYKNLLFELF